MTDTSGYGFGCGDANGQIVFQKTPTPNVPGNTIISGNVYNYPLAAGRLSHCRSWGLDSSGLLYLAFLDEAATLIQISHGTDNINLTWSTPVTIFQDPAYDDVRDPSMHLKDNVIHLSFLRHNTSTGNYELCYTKGNISDLIFSMPVVVDSSTSKFEDAHIQVGTYFTNVPVAAIAYEKGTTLYLNYSTCDGAASWHTPVQVQTTTMATEDCDMVFLNHGGSLTEDLIIIWSEADGTGMRHIITRMAHFLQ